MKNFEFLKSDYNELYQLCSSSEKYINEDTSVSMLKARQAIEWIVSYLGCTENDLFVNINNLEDRNIADSRIIDKFHFIRKKANRSVHNNDTNIEGVLDALVEVCIWLVLSHDRKTYSPIKFTEEEKAYVNKYSGHGKFSFGEEKVDKSSVFNPLEIVGSLGTNEVDIDPLEQDVFETKEEYYARIESLPAMRIGYVFLDESQIDKFTGIAFPLFHINKNNKIESNPIAALYVSGKDFSNLDGFLKAKLRVHNDKIYCNYDSLIVEDDNGDGVKLNVISWNKYGYESEEEFALRIRKLPLLPVGIARPIRKEYDLSNQKLPFEVKPMAYVSNVYNINTIDCHLDRDRAKEICLINDNFTVYSTFNESIEPFNIHFYSQNSEGEVLFDTEGNFETHTKEEVVLRNALKKAEQGNIEAQYWLAKHYDEVNDEIETLKWHTQAAKNNNADAQYWLYKHYNKNKSDEAFKWLEKAADNGNIDALSQLVDWYDNVQVTANTAKDAYKWYLKAAFNGNAKAKFKLAQCYESGVGTEKNEQKAFQYYEEATKQGHLQAMYKLAYCYEVGLGTEKNSFMASELYEKATDQGTAEEVFEFAVYYENNCGVEVRVFELYEKAAVKGHVEAQYKVAQFFVNGFGTRKNKQKAFKWFEKAALQGHTEAQFQLAECYANGTGVKENKELAIEWYEKAAKQGYTKAQHKLANCYRDAFGTEENKQQAFAWYMKAAEQGHVDAQYELANCYKNTFGTEENKQQAFAWYMKAAEQGHVNAQYELGVCYEFGYGTEANKQQAFAWYEKAAKQGYKEAELKIICFVKQNNTANSDSVENLNKARWDAERYEFEILHRYAEAGDADKQNLLGFTFEQRGDYRPAVYWYTIAAEQGHAGAQFNLGQCYENGSGIEKDQTKAVFWYKKASEQGHQNAKRKLNILTKENTNTAKENTNTAKENTAKTVQGTGCLMPIIVLICIIGMLFLR